MPLRSYGVLKGKAIEVRLGAGQSPHYQVRLIDDTTDYRIASTSSPSFRPRTSSSSSSRISSIR
jgi:uncharacterized protein YukJ